MVNIPTRFKALVIAIVSISVFSISACKKDSPVDIGDGLYVPPAVTIDKTTGYANEVLTISYWNIPELDQYTGEFNGQAVDVYNIGTTLSFLIPNVSQGSYPFTITVDGKVLEYNIQVLEAPLVGSADQLIQDFQTQTDVVFDSLQLYLDNRYGNPANYPTSIQQDMAVWEQIEMEAQQAINQMNASEKEELAALLLANQEWINDIGSLLIDDSYNFKTESAAECKAIITEGKEALDNGNTFSALGLGISAYWCGVLLHIDKKTDNAFSKAATLWEATENQFIQITLVNLIGRRIDQLSKEIDELGGSSSIAEEIEDADENKVEAGPLEYCNGERKRVFANIRFRTVRSSDTQSNTPYAPFANFYGNFIAAYQDYVETITQPLVWRPEYRNASRVEEFNRFLSVPQSSVSNSNAILINTQIVDDFWEIIFATDEPNEQAFDYDIKYDDGYVQLQKTFSGTVKECVLQIGEVGPGGGIIVYDEGNYDKGWRFVEMTKQPIGTATWGCFGSNINTGQSLDYGSGLEKTQAIISSCSEAGIAARLCDSHSQNGYDDWFLPSAPNLYLSRMYGLTPFVVSPPVQLPSLPTYVWSSATTQDIWDPESSLLPSEYNLGGVIDTLFTGTLYSGGAYLNKDDVYGVYAARRF